MTYPPGSPGYPPAQPTTQFAAPTQQPGRAPEPGPPAPSKLPLYLSIAVAVLGLAVYLSNFGPQLSFTGSDFPQLGSGSTVGLGLAVIAAVVAALIAGVGVVPKQKGRPAWAAIFSTLAFLLVIAEVVNAPSEFTIGWGLYLLIAFTVLQAGAGIAYLLLDAGVITAPEPKPTYEQPYGQYAPPQYYGQPGQQHGGPQQGPPQRQGYPQQSYGGYSNGPSAGGFSGAQHGGPPTPPTGFPTYGQPQPAGSSASTGPQAQAQPHQGPQTQQSASQQAGPPPS